MCLVCGYLIIYFTEILDFVVHKLVKFWSVLSFGTKLIIIELVVILKQIIWVICDCALLWEITGEMFVIEDKLGAIALMQVSLLLLGTWPAFLTLLEQRGRLPQHTYLDYSLTNFFAAVFIALTFGQLGDAKPNFFTQLSQVFLHFSDFLLVSVSMLSINLVFPQVFTQSYHYCNWKFFTK